MSLNPAPRLRLDPRPGIKRSLREGRLLAWRGLAALLSSLLVVLSHPAGAQTWQKLDSAAGGSSPTWQKLCSSGSTAGKWSALTACANPVKFTLVAGTSVITQSFINNNAFSVPITAVGCMGECYVSSTYTTCVVGNSLSAGATCDISIRVNPPLEGCGTSSGTPSLANAGGTVYGRSAFIYTGILCP